MTEYANPIPLLYEHFNLGPRAIAMALGRQYYDTVVPLFDKPTLPKDDWDRLRGLTLTYWGQCKDAQVRRVLWKVYYPNNLPNIFQVLHYRAGVSIDQLAKGGHPARRQMSPDTVRLNLVRPKVPLAQVRHIASFASRTEEAMRSPKSWDGVDPIYMEIHRALRDRKRIKYPSDLD